MGRKYELTLLVTYHHDSDCVEWALVRALWNGRSELTSQGFGARSQELSEISSSLSELVLNAKLRADTSS